MTIDDLASICHRGKNLEEKVWWYRCHRILSIRITWLLICTSITANQVSWVMIGCGIVAAFLSATENAYTGPISVLLLYFAFLLDKVDGELARYRNTESWSGVYLDWLFHRLVPMLFHLGLFIRVYHRHPSNVMLLLVVLAGPVMLLARENSQVVYNLYPRKKLPVSQSTAMSTVPVRRVVLPAQVWRRRIFDLIGEYQNPLGTVVCYLPVLLVDGCLQTDLLTWVICCGFGGICIIALHRTIRLGCGEIDHEVHALASRLACATLPSRGN